MASDLRTRWSANAPVHSSQASRRVEGTVDGSLRPVLPSRHQLRVHAQREAGIGVAQVLNQRTMLPGAQRGGRLGVPQPQDWPACAALEVTARYGETAAEMLRAAE